MSGCPSRSLRTAGAVAAALALAGCGAGARQDASERNATFTVRVAHASFPASQRLSQHTRLVITVSNAGSATIPDVTVTITDPTIKHPTTVRAFDYRLERPNLAARSRPVWIVDRSPGPCGERCRSAGAGGALTAYSNTWALGPLAPGASATFEWALTAVRPGRHVLRYQVAAGLNGKATTRLQRGARPRGTFTVTIAGRAEQSYVDNQGHIVRTR